MLNLLLHLGARSFHRKSLHHIGNEQNPYEQAISIIGKTLSSFDEDNMIPCFGFGDGISSIEVLRWYFIFLFLNLSSRYLKLYLILHMDSINA
jgi:E3 ubiquitin-protein ligase RGLG